MKKKVENVYVRVPALNIDKFLSKVRNRVPLIGVELEGGWDKLPKGVLELEKDTSVFNTSGMDLDNSFKRLKFPDHLFGEIPFGPVPPIGLKAKLAKLYPTMVDHTCGMHVHMSFENVFQYNLLADSPAYMETVIEYLGRWAKEEELKPDHPIWERLDGKNKFCEIKFWPDAQIKKPHKQYGHDGQHRYTFIHYCWRIKTVECRGLPMMATPELAHKAIIRLLDITSAYLLAVNKTRKMDRVSVPSIEDEIKISLRLEKGLIYEEFTE